MFYNIGKFSKLIGKNIQTLRNWEKTGKLIPAYITSGKHRMYSEEQLNLFILKPNIKEKINIGYARISSKKQTDDLNRQINLLEIYLINKNKSFKIITDIGSGINYNKQGLNELINMINKKEIDTIFLLYKDRLVRFGFELIKYFCDINDVKIEIINQIVKSDEDDLVDDILNIIHVFSCKINGRRSHLNKKIIMKLNEENI
jgi:predicted site-specific integrase-resolvase